MNTDNSIVVYRMAWIKCALMTISAGLAAWVTAMDGVLWETLAGTEKVKVLFGCGIVMAGIMVAFLDKTIQTIQGEREEIPGTPESVAAGRSVPSDRVTVPTPPKIAEPDK